MIPREDHLLQEPQDSSSLAVSKPQGFFPQFIEKLREWEDYYNYHRPHGALDGQTPYERLISKTRAQVSTKS